jgi:hypothetical protein
MAEHPEEEDDESGSEYSDDDTATLLDDHIIDGPFSDDALRGLRLLTNLLEGNEHDQADVLAEYDYVLPEEDEEEEAHPIPSREFVTRSLQEQGVTYEQLAAWILMDHEEYESQYEEIENFSGDLWGKLRVMITNYRPAEPEAPAEEAPAAPAELPVEEEEDQGQWLEDPNALPGAGLRWYPTSYVPPPPLAFEVPLSPIHPLDEFLFSFDERVDFTSPVFADLDDIRIDLAYFMEDIDYTAQPKTPICT